MSVPPFLGAIADDFTGAADLASMLSSGGVRTALVLRPERADASSVGSYQAVVIALKTRSIPSGDACTISRSALDVLRSLDAQQFYFKYCSTFDSSAEGNIGQVSDALMDALDVPFTVAVPALPVNGRTQYLGYLFVGDRLLSETHMRDHPVHPMTEPNLVRHLQHQTMRPVGLIDLATVASGPAAITSKIKSLTDEGIGIALVDAVTEDDLIRIADAVVDLPFLTGGSGLGAALAESWKRRGMLAKDASSAAEPLQRGPTLILSGSCSDATLGQLNHAQHRSGEGIRLDVLHLIDNNAEALDRIFDDMTNAISSRGWALVYSSADPGARRQLLHDAAERGCDQTALGALIESAHAELARRSVDAGSVQHLIAAGGETSGAVANALDLAVLEVADVLDPGVPILRPNDAGDRTVTFKSGNFGSVDFFTKALRRLGPAIKESV